jgi:hypothetical protein
MRMGRSFRSEGVDLHYIDPVGVGIYQRMEFCAIYQLIETRVSKSLRRVCL